MDVFINCLEGVLSQCMSISNRHKIYFKYLTILQSQMNEWMCGTSTKWILFSSLKEQTIDNTLQHGWKSLCLMEEARSKKIVPTMCFIPFIRHVLKGQIYRSRLKIEAFKSVTRKAKMGHESSIKEFEGLSSWREPVGVPNGHRKWTTVGRRKVQGDVFHY